jgi:hypothetical protein
MPSVRVQVGGKPHTLTLQEPCLQEHLTQLGYTGSLQVQWTSGINPGEYYQEESGEDFVCINPHFVVLLRLGLIPLAWPAALCPLPLYRKRLLQTLAHELRHAQQLAGLTPVTEKTPWLSYEKLRLMGRVYILLALVGAGAIQWLLAREAVLPVLVLGGILLTLAAVYIVLAYLNYHLDPLEIDARTYERSHWQEWSACLTLTP